MILLTAFDSNFCESFSRIIYGVNTETPEGNVMSSLSAIKVAPVMGLDETGEALSMNRL